jgi:hypothetical protein
MNVTKKNDSRGRVFQRVYRNRRGELQKTSTWFLKYRIGGKPVTIPSSTQDYEEAVAILRQKVGKATQPSRSDDFPSVVINQLLDLVIDDYRSKDRYTTYDVEHRVAKHLRLFFGTKEPTEVTATLLEQYAGSRASHAAPATINKELAICGALSASGTGMSHCRFPPLRPEVSVNGCVGPMG